MLFMPPMVTENKGPRRVVTATWLTAARDRVREIDRTQKEIAEACGTSSAYFTQLLGGKYDTSTFLDCFSKQLGIPTVPIAVATPDLQEILDTLADFDKDMLEQIKVIAESLKALKTKKSS